MPIKVVFRLGLNPVGGVGSLQVLTNLSLSPQNQTHGIQARIQQYKRERARNGPEP